MESSVQPNWNIKFGNAERWPLKIYIARLHSYYIHIEKETVRCFCCHCFVFVVVCFCFLRVFIFSFFFFFFFFWGGGGGVVAFLVVVGGYFYLISGCLFCRFLLLLRLVIMIRSSPVHRFVRICYMYNKICSQLSVNLEINSEWLLTWFIFVIYTKMLNIYSAVALPRGLVKVCSHKYISVIRILFLRSLIK